MTPRVLIIIATGIVGGPGKGLFQFLKIAQKRHLFFILCNFGVRGIGTDYEFRKVAEEKGIPVTLIEQKGRLDTGMIDQVLTIIRENNINIIQTHGYKGHLLAWFVRRKVHVKWIAMAHGWTYENIRIRIYNFIEWLLFRYADLAVAVSPPLYATLSARRGRNRPTVQILNAVGEQDLNSTGEDVRDNWNIGKQETLIGVFGRLSPEKGHSYLLKAFAALPVKENLRIIIVGDGQEADNLKAQADQLGISKYIVFAGYQSNIKDYFEAINLLVLPSLTEGIPNVVLEAMIHGKPVIATDVGGVREIIESGKNGWIVPPADAEGLAAAISAVTGDTDNLRKTGAIARDSLFPKFSPEYRADRILEQYYKLLAAD